MNEDAYRRAHKILSLFLTAENLPAELIDKVHAWMVDGNNQEEKDEALWNIFNGTAGNENVSIDE